MISLNKWQWYFPDNLKICDDEIFNTINDITSLLKPREDDRIAKIYSNLYLPVKDNGRIYSVGFSLGFVKDSQDFDFYSQDNKKMNIKEGDLEFEFYNDFFKDIYEHMNEIKNGRKINIPATIRRGSIRSKYLLEDLMDEKDSLEIENKYKQQIIPKKLNISLNDFIHTCNIVYKSLNPDLDKDEMTLFKHYSDFRREGMLEIKDYDSCEEFDNWLNFRTRTGGHPFEILYSNFRSSIHLYPLEDRYSLRVGTNFLAEGIVKICNAFFENNVPFESTELEKSLSYLKGEKEVRVNEGIFSEFRYESSKKYYKKYFHNIEWDDIIRPNFK